MHIILFPSDTGDPEQAEDNVLECRTIGYHLTCATDTARNYGDPVACVCRGMIHFPESCNAIPV